MNDQTLRIHTIKRVHYGGLCLFKNALEIKMRLRQIQAYSQHHTPALITN